MSRPCALTSRSEPILGGGVGQEQHDQTHRAALITLLTRAAKQAPASQRGWIDELQQQAFALSSEEERRQAITALSAE